ncbi:hypothetical protein VTI74DRAFT_1022 [Chaetomium olivicolor]
MQPPPSARAAAKSAAAAARVAAPKTALRASRPSPSSGAPTGDDGGRPKWKLMFYTGLFAAVIFTGTIYGAGLKTRQEWKAEKQKIQEASVDEKVAILEQRRADLVRHKDEIEGKLVELRARIKARAEHEAEVRETSGR